MAADELDDLDVRDVREDEDGYAEDLVSFDEDDDTDDEDDDDLDDELDDATDEDIDLVVAAYREDGEPVVVALANDLANDLDELITQLRRLPGDSGVVGAVSIAGDFFVLVRVRGENVQVLLSDAFAAHDWPIARDVADFLGIDPPDEDDDDEAMGDLDIFADLGIGDFDLESIIDEEDSSEDAVGDLFDQLKFGPQFERALREGPQHGAIGRRSQR